MLLAPTKGHHSAVLFERVTRPSIGSRTTHNCSRLPIAKAAVKLALTAAVRCCATLLREVVVQPTHRQRPRLCLAHTSSHCEPPWSMSPSLFARRNPHMAGLKRAAPNQEGFFTGGHVFISVRGRESGVSQSVVEPIRYLVGSGRLVNRAAKAPLFVSRLVYFPTNDNISPEPTAYIRFF